MIEINYTMFKRNFEKYLDLAVKDSETILITYRRYGNLVLMPAAKYYSIQKQIDSTFEIEETTLEPGKPSDKG